jgi:hypothetical protein
MERCRQEKSTPKLGGKKMTREMNITVVNKLILEKRDLNIYHHYTQSAHLISYNRSITLPLGSVETGDYLHISLVSGPGPLKRDCRIDLPLWVDFQFSIEGNVKVIHAGDARRIQLTISPGPGSCELRVTRSDGFQFLPPSDHITISDAVVILRK